MAKADILLPVRDGAKFVREAVESLLQDASSISTLVVVDDGSTDETPEIIRDIPFPAKKVILSRPASGLVDALNYGLTRCTAKYIARMDSDDISLPGRLPAQIKFLVDNPHIAVVGTQVEYINQEGLVEGRSNYPLSPTGIRRLLTKSGVCPLSHPTVLMRREQVVSVGGYHRAFKDAEDFDLWLRLSERYELANLPEIFLKYRRHSGAISNGANLRQGFSRDLALLCARERECGRIDPMENILEPPFFDPAPLSTRHKKLAELASAYNAIEKISREQLEDVSNEALKAISKLGSEKYIGEGRRRRYKFMSWAAKTMLRRRQFRESIVAFWRLLEARLGHSKLFRAKVSRDDTASG